MYSTAQKGSSQRNGYGSVPFLCAFSDSKDAAELLRMISSHDCRAQNFIACLHVRPEIWRDSQSWRQPQWNPERFPWSRFRRTPVVGHLAQESAAAQPDLNQAKHNTAESR